MEHPADVKTAPPQKKDRTVLYVSIAIVIVFTLIGAIFPDGNGKVVYAINAFLCDDMGWLYLLTTAFFLFFGIAIAFSRYGKIRLGKDDDKPQFGNFQWFALLFGGGIGIGLVFWSVAEPMMHYAAGPMDEPLTQEAMRTAIRITFMHEGIHCWGMFAVVGLALGYAQYRKGLPFLISSAFHPLIGDRIHGPIGKTIDIISTFATIFGISTSLGLGAMQISGGISHIWGVKTDAATTAVIIGLITTIFTLATVSGLHKWMAKVVNLKVWLSILFMVFLLVFGGFVFIMQNMTDTLASYFSTFINQTFWYGNPKWLSSWTVFYWAWWIAWSPFCGQFFARVSKGRTVKEMILGGTLLPAGFSFIWITIYAAAGFRADQSTGGLISKAVDTDYTTALYALLEQLPLYQIMGPLALVLVVLCFTGAAGAGPLDIINQGLITGMNEVGVLFKANEMFVPEVIASAEAMEAGVSVVKPLINQEDLPNLGTIFVGTVKGDLHDIGKNLVVMMLESVGFNVINVGVDISPEQFVEGVKIHKPDVIAMSALLTTTMLHMKDTIELLKEEGLRDQVKVIIGGAPVSEDFAEEIAADGYSPDAISATDL